MPFKLTVGTGTPQSSPDSNAEGRAVGVLIYWMSASSSAPLCPLEAIIYAADIDGAAQLKGIVEGWMRAEVLLGRCLREEIKGLK